MSARLTASKPVILLGIQMEKKIALRFPSRMREGNLSAIFFSIWIPSKITGFDAVNRALIQIDAVREQVRKHPNDLALATTAAEIREAHKHAKIAALMGVEGGHMINSDLAVLRTYAAL